MEKTSISIKIIGLIIGVVLIIGGLGWYWFKSDLISEITNRMVELKRIDEKTYEIYVGKSNKKLLMIEIKGEVSGNRLEKIDLNEKIFSLELMNKILNKTSMEVVAGIPKSTDELSLGKVLVGTLFLENKGGEINFNEIKITFGEVEGQPEIETVNNYKLKLK